MGQRSRIFHIAVVSIVFGVITSMAFAFAEENTVKHHNPLGAIFSFFQELKYEFLPQILSSQSSTELNSAAVILQLKDEVTELKTRLNSIENPPKIYTTELHPVTDIDCSSRNMVEAFLSGWCPHQTRNIYFIEDARVKKNSVIAITMEENINNEIAEKNVCGVINQDVFNFSFHDEKTGKAKLLEGLHGFIMKCDQSPLDNSSILRYTIINT